MRDLPRWVWPLALTMTVVALIPLALIARARVVPSPVPRIHIIQDMDNQPKLGPQAASPLFADTRAMRPPVAGTVERAVALDLPVLTSGRRGEQWVEVVPLALDEAAQRRGKERYEVFCTPCHGSSGVGDGPVSKRAEELAEGTWAIPSSLFAEQSRNLRAGQLFDTVSRGVRNMPGYGAQIGVSDRWAIVAHVQALQRGPQPPVSAPAASDGAANQ